MRKRRSVELSLPLMPDSFEPLLDRAAVSFGIAPDFWDIFGKHHITTSSTKQAILSAMGVDADSLQSLESSLAGVARLEWERLLPPAVVASQSDGVYVPLTVPSELL